MERRIAELLGLVREEISLYRDLIEHARRKTALLVRGSVGAILESNKVEETYNVKLRFLEAELLRLCSDLGAAFKIPSEEFTLLKLAEGLEAPVAAEIKSQTTLFKNLVDQLKAVNRRNMRLVDSSVCFSRGLLDLLSNTTSSYQGTGTFRPIPATQTAFSRQA